MGSPTTLRKNQSEPKVFWQPHEGPQTEALSRSEFEILYGGAKGGGKTESGIVWCEEPDYIANPRYRFLVIRENGKDLAGWLDRASFMYAPVGGVVVGREIRFPSGARGWTGHLQDQNSYKHYIGTEYQKLLIEELTLIGSEELYLKIVSSCRSTIGLKPQVFCTTNPGEKGHIWVKNRFVKHGNMKPYKDPVTGRWRIFVAAKVTDNPTLMQEDPEYINWLRGLPEKLRRAWLDGDWNVFEGQFFDTWDERIHVYEPFTIPKDWPRFRSIDWGYSDNLCCLWYAVGPWTLKAGRRLENHIFVYREYYRNRMTDGEYAGAIKGLSKYHDGSDENIEYTVGDPSSFSVEVPDTGVTRFETFAYNGIGVMPAENDRVEGWSRVREYLEPRDFDGESVSWVHISKDCPNLIRTLPSLVHHDRKVEDISDGMEDHAPDSLRYGLQSRQPLSVKKVQKYRTNLEAAEAQMERRNSQQVDVWR